jgi:hypothetical protein
MTFGCLLNGRKHMSNGDLKGLKILLGRLPDDIEINTKILM